MGNKNSGTKFSHLSKDGDVRMVDVTDKGKTFRVAKAEGIVQMNPGTVQALSEGETPKGNVFTTAKIAGIQAAKRTAEIVPLCHPLELSWVDLEFELADDRIHIEAVVKTWEATGVEMEALTAVSAAALTIYDMCKGIDKNITISRIRLVEKTGGISDYATDYRPRVGVIVLSDSVYAGNREDTSGEILREGFTKAGCPVEHPVVLPDGSDVLAETVKLWIKEGVELIVTSGGTGLGPRDLTIPIMEKLLESRLRGVEQVLHASGRNQVNTAILSRLAAGTVGNSIVICLPGSPRAAEVALRVLIPSIFHAFPMMKGHGHPSDPSASTGH